MEITVVPQEATSQVEITVAVSKDDFSSFVKRAIGTLAQHVELKGFRKGKAPRNMAMEHIGQDRILHEAMDRALPHFFAAAVIEKNIEVIGRPSISVQELGMDVPFRFRATVDVIPKITLGATSALSVQKKEVIVSDDQVSHELQRLANMRAATAQVARAAKTGDVVLMDFQVTMDGTPIEGGASKNHPVTIGEGRFVPGFEDGIIGMSIGQKKTFPIQGKQAQATVNVISVQEKKVPVLDDTFAQSLGGAFTTLDELKEKLRSNMLDEYTATEEERYRGELAEQLMNASQFAAIPASLVEHEIDRRMGEFATMLSYQQQTIEEYAAKHNTTIANMRETMKESATKQVKVGLVLRELARVHTITATEEEIREAVNAELARFSSLEEAHKQVDPQDMQDYAAHAIKNKKTLDLLALLANKNS